MLTLPRLRTRGSPMSSFSDSARWRCPFVSPADVRLNIARRPRSEVERVGAASLAACAVRCGVGGESWGRSCASGDDVWGIDMENRDVVTGAGEEERGATGALLGRYGLELALRRIVSVLWVGVGGGSRNLVISPLRFKCTADVISTR